MRKVWLMLVGLSLVLSACGAPIPAATPTAAPVMDTPGPSATPSLVPISTGTQAAPTASVSPTPQGSPTPDTRLTPDRWQEWPIVPEITNRAKEIYAAGQALGRDPRHFSKVGDCQSINEAFLGFYDLQGASAIPDGYDYLIETLDYYAGGFNRESQSVQGGYNVASVLLPMWADPVACQAGETPLACEIRLYNPSVMIISMETSFPGRTSEKYKGYMRQILDYVIEHGVVPILATKADNVEGDHSINLATAELAYEYDVPLWNFWLAAQPLENHGIDIGRDNLNFHITVEAWNVRSFTALQTLDAVRRGLLGIGAAEIPTAQPGQTGETGDVEFKLEQVSTFTGETRTSGKIYFTLQDRSGDTVKTRGVFWADLQAGVMNQVSSEGTRLRDVSPDGGALLISRGGELYAVKSDGTDARLLTSNLLSASRWPARWSADGQAALVIEKQDAGASMWRISLDGTRAPLVNGDTQPAALLQSEPLTWARGACDNTACVYSSVYRQAQDGSASLLLEVTDGVMYAIGEKYSAYGVNDGASFQLWVTGDGGVPHQVQTPNGALAGLFWEPDGTTLAVVVQNVDTYTGKVRAVRTFETFLPGFGGGEHTSTDLLSPQTALSSDGRAVLFGGTRATETGYQTEFQLLNLDTDRLFTLAAGAEFASSDYLSITDLYWR